MTATATGFGVVTTGTDFPVKCQLAVQRHSIIAASRLDVTIMQTNDVTVGLGSVAGLETEVFV